jgi:peptide/nickel transport system permease protein
MNGDPALLAQRIALGTAVACSQFRGRVRDHRGAAGDAAQEQLGQEATPEALAALRAQMGLDVPAPQRYVRWLGGL